MKASLEIRSIRLSGGEEVLVAFLKGEDGRTGWGISFELDATAARRMAERQAGFDAPPDYSTPA